MSNQIMRVAFAGWLTLAGAVAVLADSTASLSVAKDAAQLDALAGQPVDVAPWAYAWRFDRPVQETPEAYFIPRRLDRLDKVYRTALAALPPEQLKSVYYDMPDLTKPLLPPPKGRLVAALLWTGGLTDYRVDLHWPGDIPSPDLVEVRTYPTSYGWFGWTVDRVLADRKVSEDGRTWRYKSGPAGKMDWAFNLRVDAATEMVAVFCDSEKMPHGAKPPVPEIALVSRNVGVWKRMDVEIEWGFPAASGETGDHGHLPETVFEGAAESDGRLEPYMAVLGAIWPLPGEKGTAVTGSQSWRTRAAGDARRGIVVPLLYAPTTRPGLDSRVTIWNKAAGVTFRVSDLDNGPILIPERGIYVTKAGSGKTARQFAAELAAKNLKTVRQRVREHREAASWDEVMREVRLWTCPKGTAVPAFPKVADPPVMVEVPDARWTAAWRAASDQLRGKHKWGGLAFEVGRVAHEMDMVGLHDQADKVYQHFLKSPGVKSDGDYADGAGELEWATGMRHDMGYRHDGTHASTGRLLFAMADRCFLTGDKEWLRRNRARMQAAADWIIRQRSLYLKEAPNRQRLAVAGLMPPCMLGDYAIPSCDWHWYYSDNAFSLQGLQRFADALAEIDPAAAAKYRDEAAAYRRDIRRVVEREAALAPVRRLGDGTYCSFVPQTAYARGAMLNLDLGAPQRPEGDLYVGSLPLAEPFAALEANDYRVVGSLSAIEEAATSPTVVKGLEDGRRAKGVSTADAWFWSPFGASFPKASHAANIYLLQDDVLNFLRFWMNCYAPNVGTDGRLWEAGQLGQYVPCTDPDNGTAGWFLENFRDLLAMEEGGNLWLARATPRVWLAQGKKIAVRSAPTYFGTLTYEIVSDVDHGRIAATVEVPRRNPPKTVLLRLRHPNAAPMKSVTVNGRVWSDFDPAREVIRVQGLTGTVVAEATY